MPTIHTGGHLAFAAGKGLGQIAAEKEAYTRGVEEARLAMQREQVETARKLRDISKNYALEQEKMNLAKKALTQKGQLGVMKETGLTERAELGEVGAMGRTLVKQKGTEAILGKKQEFETGKVEYLEKGRMTRKQMELEKPAKETQAQKIRNLNFVNVLRQNKVIKPGQLGTVSMDDIGTYDQITESLASQKVDPENPTVKKEIDQFITNYFAMRVLGKELSNDEKEDAESFLEKYNAIIKERGEAEVEFVKPTTGIGSYWTLQEKGKALSERGQSKADQRATYNRLRAQGVGIEEAKKKAGIQ